MQPKFRINRITGLEIVRGGDQNFTDTHTHRHRHTRAEAHFISLVFLRKYRNKTKNRKTNPTGIKPGPTRCEATMLLRDSSGGVLNSVEIQFFSITLHFLDTQHTKCSWCMLKINLPRATYIQSFYYCTISVHYIEIQRVPLAARPVEAMRVQNVDCSLLIPPPAYIMSLQPFQVESQFLVFF